jgi:hypothetical protein
MGGTIKPLDRVSIQSALTWQSDSRARADFRGAATLFALRRPGFRPIERVMGQQHRVRVKRRRRVAYLDRKKAAAKAVPVRREAPKSKPKAKKQVAPAPTPET